VGIYWLGAQLPGRALEVWEIAKEAIHSKTIGKFIKPQKRPSWP